MCALPRRWTELGDEPLAPRGRGTGDHAFEALAEAHRASLHAHCYRMLGSAHDADDALQDALLRAWRGLDRFEGRSTPASWLHRIATNVCLDMIARRPKRTLPMDFGPASESGDDAGRVDGPVWIEPYPHDGGAPADAPEARYEQREALELAFIAALQHLPARQRAVLILRDVLGFSARETAAVLDTTTAAVTSALQRARRAVDSRLPARSQQTSLRALGDARVNALVERFVGAFERGDVEAILELLTDEVTFQMPPYTSWCRGREAVGDSWLMPGGPAPRLRYLPARANGQVAVGTYVLEAESQGHVAIALDVLQLSESGIDGVIAFRSPELFPRFGLPLHLPHEASLTGGA